MPKLKVFRTPIGFHDAYVAAPSRAAALRAWGSDKDLFARGSAEEVTDPDLIKEPLEQPGTVFKRSRGTADEQIAALSVDETPKAKARAPKPAKAVKPRGPRPDRAALDEAESALAKLTDQQGHEVDRLDEEITALEQERAALIARHQSEIDKLERQRAARATAYDRAMAKWRDT